MTPLEPDRCRIHSAGDGLVYRVRIAPFERAGRRPGVDWRVNALVYETPDGEWVGSVPVYHNVLLDALTAEDLDELLEQAIGNG